MKVDVKPLCSSTLRSTPFHFFDTHDEMYNPGCLEKGSAPLFPTAPLLQYTPGSLRSIEEGAIHPIPMHQRCNHSPHAYASKMQSLTFFQIVDLTAKV